MIDVTNSTSTQAANASVNTINQQDSSQTAVGATKPTNEISSSGDSASIVTLSNGTKEAALTYTKQSLAAAATTNSTFAIDDSSALLEDAVLSFGGTKQGPP